MPTASTTRVLSQRGVRPTVARCMGYEFEDRTAELLSADIVVPTHHGRSEQVERIVKGAAKQWRRGARLSPRYQAPADDSTADVMFMHCQFPADSLLLHAVPQWRRRTGTAIAFIEELWCGSMDSWGGTLDLFEQFDHVYVGIAASAAQLGERLDTPVSYLPYSVDTTRFAPHDPDAARPIDVLTVGRRSPVTHDALLDWSQRENRFYHFDSFSPRRCHDLAEHRIMYSRLHQQSMFAIANRGIGAGTAGNAGEEALPARYFETAAAGGVLVGLPPDLPELADQFGWTDAVIPAPFDDPDMPARLVALAAEPERLRNIRRRNIAETMRRHDTVHRLATMLTDTGIELPHALRSAVEERVATADSINPPTPFTPTTGP